MKMRRRGLTMVVKIDESIASGYIKFYSQLQGGCLYKFDFSGVAGLIKKGGEVK